jgi:hypothetical protein
MAHRFGPTRGEVDNNRGRDRPSTPIGSPRADSIMARSKTLHDEAEDTTAVELDRLSATMERTARENDDHNSLVGGVQIGC